MDESRAYSALQHIVRRERLVMALTLTALTLFAWIYLLEESAAMHSAAVEARMRAAMGMGDMRTWGAADWFGLFVMWAVMMVGTMLPSASPVILLVLAVYRRRGDDTARLASVAFAGGYLLAWTLFSAFAATLQIVLHRSAWLTPDMATGSTIVAGLVLVAAGVYQWLPIKNTCLTHCRSPIGFLALHWKEGALGGLALGVLHGLFCIGCCWALMTLLLVVGVMNLVWVAAIAMFVMAEKLLARGPALSRVGGGLLIVWGLSILLGRYTWSV